MNHLLKFLRSVLPADSTQLLFIAGITCLVIAPRQRWLPAGLIALAGNYRADALVERASVVVSFAVWPLIFSGIAGYLICFRPGDRPVRRILWLVFVPAVAGVGLIFSQILTLSRGTSSVLD